VGILRSSDTRSGPKIQIEQVKTVIIREHSGAIRSRKHVDDMRAIIRKPKEYSWTRKVWGKKKPYEKAGEKA